MNFKEIDVNDLSYDIIHYFLNGSFKIKILMELYESKKTVKELKKNLKKSESNILHYMSNLEKYEIIEKNKNEYTLSSKGYLLIKHIIKLYDNWESINKNIDFLDEHADPNLPIELNLNIDIWKSAELIISSHLEYDKAIRIYEESIFKSKDIKIILPIFSKPHLKIILESLKKNHGNLNIITSKFIITLIAESELGTLFSQLKSNKQITIWYTSSHNNLNKFLTCTENFAALFLFYENRNCDDSEMLFLTDKKSIEKLNDLIDKNKFNF
ncbi:MAG: ArsR family transcriptional regulator [Methanobacteriaceae archaeon]|nr:ArsR family transcriptional regulator [Methanobacteriaceae archaeon]